MNSAPNEPIALQAAMSSSYMAFASARIFSRIWASVALAASSFANNTFMRSMAQNKFTAVGRVPARRAQIFSNSGLKRSALSALDWIVPRAMPYAAETPMAGAPRTTMVTMTSATSS